MATNDPLQQAVGAGAWVEPIEAYRRLGDRSPLLLDRMGRHPEARLAHLAMTPVLEARGDHDGIEVTWLDPHEGGRTRIDGPPLAGLKELLARYRYPQGTPGFTGGFVGYFAYEFVEAIEATLPRRETPGPLFVLRLCRDVVSFDRVARTSWVTTTDLPGENTALSRRDSILAALASRAGDDPAGTSPDGPALARGPPAVWSASLDRGQFIERVESLRRLIAEGDLFQANIATRFTTPLATSPADLFAAMQAHNPSPFMALMDFTDHALVSNSPEQLFATDGGIVRARPIAGTRRRGKDTDDDHAMEQELLHDGKERAEHTMLVDLLRNDIAKVAVAGSVHVPERMSVERYRRVMHLVSRVQGRLRPGVGFVDRLAALFPGGTITGAPKHRACLRIHEAEPVPRGPYTGSAGFLSWDQMHDHWNILIRTLVLQDGVAAVHAGSGIVMDSVAEREWREAGHKAQALLEAATGQVDDARRGAQDVGSVTRHGEWAPGRAVGQVSARVLIIDNYDSFTWNLADYCAAHGADVAVVRNDGDWQAAAARFDATHIILSPGPGWPDEAGCCVDVLEWAAHRPVLGVCLGHQVMAHHTGGEVRVAPAVHGKTAWIHHDGHGLLAGSPSPFEATRYHSLVVDAATLPADWRPAAWLEDGMLMAMEHRHRPWYGLQFHPESLCTPAGLEIVRRFLQR